MTDKAKEVAKEALGIEWEDTESAARIVARSAAKRIEALEAVVEAAREVVKDYPVAAGDGTFVNPDDPGYGSIRAAAAALARLDAQEEKSNG